MKLRIRGDSICLRLKRGKVNKVTARKSIVEETNFDFGPLVKHDAAKNSNVRYAETVTIDLTVRRFDRTGLDIDPMDAATQIIGRRPYLIRGKLMTDKVTRCTSRDRETVLALALSRYGYFYRADS